MTIVQNLAAMYILAVCIVGLITVTYAASTKTAVKFELNTIGSLLMFVASVICAITVLF